MKEIYFCVDIKSYKRWGDIPCHQLPTYLATGKAIQEGFSPIVTASLAHLSFDLLDKGYNIYLCKGDKKVKIEVGMPLSNKGMSDHLHRAFNEDLLDWFVSGWFDELLNSKE